MFAHIHVDISVGFGTKQECKRNKPRDDEKGMATFRRLTTCISFLEAALDIALKTQSAGYFNQTCRPSIEQDQGQGDHKANGKPVAMLLYIMLLKKKYHYPMITMMFIIIIIIIILLYLMILDMIY